MTISQFWGGILIGAILGFGAALVIFLPIVWTHTDLEDALDARRLELKRLISSIEQIRARLDEMIDRRTGSIFQGVFEPENGKMRDLTARKMGKYGGSTRPLRP